MSETQHEQHARTRRCILMAWQLFQGRGGLTRRGWCEEFGVGYKTVQRDVRHIREALGWKIKYDARTTEYYLEAE